MKRGVLGHFVMDSGYLNTLFESLDNFRQYAVLSSIALEELSDHSFTL